MGAPIAIVGDGWMVNGVTDYNYFQYPKRYALVVK